MSDAKGKAAPPRSGSRRLLRFGLTVGLVLAVGWGVTLIEHFVVHEAMPRVEAKATDFNDQTRDGIAQLVPLRIGWNFLRLLTHRPCTCPGVSHFDCEGEDAGVVKVSMCKGPSRKESSWSPSGWGFRLTNATVETFFELKSQSWLSIVLFGLALLIAVSECWDVEPWPLVILLSIPLASAIGMVFWLLAWLVSAIALLVLATLALASVAGGWKVAEHHIIHPLESRLARLFRLEDSSEHQDH